MRQYLYKYKKYIFKILLSDITYRFENSGIYQIVKIYIDDKLIFQTEWGVDYFIRLIKNPDLYDTEYNFNYNIRILYNDNYISFVNETDDGILYFIEFDIDETTKFMEWLTFCSLPISEQRKIKLNNLAIWKENQSV